MMNSDKKTLNGLLSGVPSYQLLNNQEIHSAQTNDLAKLIQHEENKFWSVKPLYAFAILQLMFGMFLICGQFILNSGNCPPTKSDFFTPNGGIDYVSIEDNIKKFTDRCEELHFPATSYAFWCGGIIFLTGLLNGLATKLKTNFLLVVSSFLCFVGYGVSLCCLIMSAVFANIFEINETHKVVLVGMAVISGLNFFVFILTSALFCRASCSCCQPRTPTIMYLSPVADDSTESSEQQQHETFNLPA